MTKLLAAALLLIGCSKKYEPSAEEKAEEAKSAPAEKPATKAPPPKKVEMPADLGSCHLTASGAVTADQTSPGGKAATNISYWFEEKERKNMMGVDGFVVNCLGDTIKFQIIPGGGKQDGMPFAPKRYELAKGKGDLVVNATFGKATMAQPTGVVDVTAFDARHIAGTVDLTGKLGGGDVKLKGTFDLVCPGYSGCVY